MSGNVTSDPPAEPALKVDTREELVYLLSQACLGALAPLTEKLQEMSRGIAAHAARTASRRQRQHAVPGRREP
jgi:hypothetical protein